MNTESIRALLTQVSEKNVSIPEAMDQLRRLPYEQLPYATVDHHRALRCGHPEVIFCPRKTPPHVVEIARRLAESGDPVLATRASEEQLASLREAFSAILISDLGRTALLNPPTVPEPAPDVAHVALVTAGTSDLPVAEEAAMTLRSMGVPARRLTDVGVAGLHRLLNQLDALQQACAVIVIAGMEGALPSVVGGLVACPVFAVPTSVGYGASLGGMTPLLGMLNSCASNVSVVNIDNGFGAAFCASLVCKQVAHARMP